MTLPLGFGVLIVFAAYVLGLYVEGLRDRDHGNS